MVCRALSTTAVIALVVATTAGAVPTTTLAPAKTLAAGASFPFPYNWSKFPTAWFAANATNWEDDAQLEAIGKYSMAILGWQHLDGITGHDDTGWTAVVYTQLTQAAIIKAKHPDLPVFVYCGYGFAFGLNAGTFPVMQDVMKDPVRRSLSGAAASFHLHFIHQLETISSLRHIFES